MAQNSRRDHPETADLLDYHAGHCSSEIEQHVSGCQQCLVKLDETIAARDALQSLPPASPPAEAWNSIREQIRPKRKQWIGRNTLQWASVAASLLIVVGTVTHFNTETIDQQGSEFNTLVKHNRNLENASQVLSIDNAVMDLGTAGKIAQIKQDITTLDMLLTEDLTSSGKGKLKNALMRERVRLMHDLVITQAQPMNASYTEF